MTGYETWAGGRELYATVHLAKKTLTRYEEAWVPHIKGRHDHYTPAELVANPQLFDVILADMRERGVGNETQRKVLVVMSSVFTAAVRWRKVSSIPVEDQITQAREVVADLEAKDLDKVMAILCEHPVFAPTALAMSAISAPAAAVLRRFYARKEKQQAA